MEDQKLNVGRRAFAKTLAGAAVLSAAPQQPRHGTPQSSRHQDRDLGAGQPDR